MSASTNEKRQWAKRCKNLVRAEMARRGVTYSDLHDRLSRAGISDTVQNLRNKINRGTFSAIFMIQVMQAINCESLRIAD